MCSKLAITAAALSHVGRCRRTNEDSFAALLHLGLFIVADGLGGNAAGEVASRMAVEVVRRFFEDDAMDGISSPGEARPGDEARLILSVERANRSIYEAGQREASKRGMATTFAGVLLAPAGAYVAHVGDSRVYRFRGGKLEQLTRDHTVLEELCLEGECSLDALAGLGEPANAVTRALGGEETVEVETRVEATARGDVFLVCSDGLWGPVPERRIAGILGAHADLGFAAELLIDLANEHGGPDNVTCVLARLGGG